MTPILAIDRLSGGYGQIQVLRDVTLQVAAGGTTALLGANGAGKTTLLRAICGTGVRGQGEIRFEGRQILGKPTEEIARAGIAHVPDGRGTFLNFTVRENLAVAATIRHDRKAVQADQERVFAYFPQLKQRLGQLAGTLSGGEQQMLAISRALMLRPKLLLLDEPSFGLAPLIVAEIFEIVRTICRDDRVSILVVEQNVALALDVATDAYLLEQGRVVLSGSAAEFRMSEAIQRAYLAI